MCAINMIKYTKMLNVNVDFLVQSWGKGAWPPHLTHHMDLLIIQAVRGVDNTDTNMSALVC